jgi:hypothetical protein
VEHSRLLGTVEEMQDAFAQVGFVVYCAEANVLTPTAGYPVAVIIGAVLPRLFQIGLASRKSLIS